jgi:hypothetical protein
MPDGFICDAIRVFESSQTGRGFRSISSTKQQQQGDAIYDQKYRDLAKDVIEKLWSLWAANEIGYHQEGTLWGSAAQRKGYDIRVTYRLKPDLAKYETPENQAKVAGTSLLIVHEATHLVRRYPYVEEEVLCRNLETVFYHDLLTGVDYNSQVKGTLLEACLSSGTSLVIEELRCEMKDEVKQLRDGRMIDIVMGMKTYRDSLQASFIRRSIDWWGGAENRLPATRGYYLNTLATDTSGDTPGNIETALKILDSIRARTEWDAVARTLAVGTLDKLRALLTHARLTQQHAYRMSKIQSLTGVNFGMHTVSA